MFKDSVSAVLRFPNGDIIIQDHVKLGKLTIPSGAVEEGECVKDAIARELKEELGIMIAVDSEPTHITHPELHGKSGFNEYRFTFDVQDNFQWGNPEPNKHLWIERMSINTVNRSRNGKSLILLSLLKSQ